MNSLRHVSQQTDYSVALCCSEEKEREGRVSCHFTALSKIGKCELLFMACTPPTRAPKDAQKCSSLAALVAQAMGNNYFLWIILVISALAVASKLSGALG